MADASTIRLLHSKSYLSGFFLSTNVPQIIEDRTPKFCNCNSYGTYPFGAFHCWLPTPSPEFMILEECWNISKHDLLVLAYYPSFAEFKKRIKEYIRTKRFKLNMRTDLTRSVS